MKVPHSYKKEWHKSVQADMDWFQGYIKWTKTQDAEYTYYAIFYIKIREIKIIFTFLQNEL